MTFACSRSRVPTSCNCSPTSMRPGTRRSSACTPTRCRGARRATTRDAGLNRYPEPQPRALVERMARLYGVPTARVPRRPRQRRGDRPAGARVLPRRHGQRRHLPADLRHVQGRRDASRAPRSSRCRWPAPGFALDTDAVIAAGRGREDRLPLLAEQSDRQPARRGARSLRDLPRARGHALVCVDEAYIEFAGRPSLAARLGELPNLVVLRTLSKAYALAGARCGTLIAGAEIVGLLKRIIPPYAIPSSTVEDVLRLTEAPQRADLAPRASARCSPSASRMRRGWQASRPCVRVFPRDANFLLVEFRDARRVPRGRQVRRAARPRLQQPRRGSPAACASRSARRSRTSGCSTAAGAIMSARAHPVHRPRRHADRGAARRAGRQPRRSSGCVPGVIPALLELAARGLSRS